MTPQPDASEQMVVVPDLSGLDKPTALALLQKRALVAQPEGAGLCVCHQQPQAGVLVARGETILVGLCNPEKRTDKDPKVPHVIGLTLREAIRQLRHKGLAATFTGSGLVIRQAPKAGSRVGQETVCKLECKSPNGGPNLMADASSRHRGVSEP
jgi:beta-lactam-binding protein with PASTA domain